MNESQLQKKCMAIARKEKILAYKIHAEGVCGFPDTIFIVQLNKYQKKGDVFFIEFKNPKNTGIMSRLQKITIEKIKSKGVGVYCCESVKDFVSILNRHIVLKRCHENEK